jgi:2-C-methyl-D-erythritol 4-phosphate cytidylyltransferase
MATKAILHYPRLDTVLMVEDAIQNAKNYPTRTELWKNLPKQVQYQTFQLILEYLLKSNKIIFTSDSKIMWIASNPLLDKAIKKGKGY